MEAKDDKGNNEEALKQKTLYFKSLSTKCAKHDFPFKALQTTTNTLMCEECLKDIESGDKSILPIFSAESEIGDDDKNNGTEGGDMKDAIMLK